ncbi:histidinol-phosphatase [Opitutales bacterium ASA1]|uniref:histidinol-phosphatase n=1 Tax=Congregicoccus parvus TaxID=3081749 RepID=UPI002B2F4D27|nr:histidinol-phosphatase [Opitutales bacterium ASA1]
MHLDEYRAFLDELTTASADVIRPLFGDHAVAVETKEDETPVTAADRGAERVLRAMIAERYPHHGIIGEEYGSERADAEFVWMLDPVDGTKSFATACPLFGTLIALLHRGTPVLGAIHQPILGQLLVGDGVTATINGRPARCRETTRIEEATLLTSDLLNPAQYQDGPAFDALARRARLVRTWGDCYGYLLVATGWADVMCDPIMNPWDVAALIPIVRGAGGVITDWHGDNPVNAASIVAAATPELHAAVVAALHSR